MNKNKSLAELIIKQHGKLEGTDCELINSILRGKTNHRVLLLLDGYDEYKPGINSDVDRAIEYSIGNCFLILTSRPGRPSEHETFISKEIRDKMDGEIIIEGFTEESVYTCGTKYLENGKKCQQMIKQAKEAGVYPLLRVPIVLLMICVVFSLNNSLPETRTGLYEMIFEMTIETTALKTFSPSLYADVKDFLDSLLYALGELSWKSLQSEVQQLLLKKVL